MDEQSQTRIKRPYRTYRNGDKLALDAFEKMVFALSMKAQQDLLGLYFLASKADVRPNVVAHLKFRVQSTIRATWNFLMERFPGLDLTMSLAQEADKVGSFDGLIILDEAATLYKMAKEGTENRILLPEWEEKLKRYKEMHSL